MLPNEKSHYALGQAVLIINISFHMMRPIFYELMVCFNQIWHGLGCIKYLWSSWKQVAGEKGEGSEVSRLCRIRNSVAVRHQSVYSRRKPWAAGTHGICSSQSCFFVRKTKKQKNSDSACGSKQFCNLKICPAFCLRARETKPRMLHTPVLQFCKRRSWS